MRLTSGLCAIGLVRWLQSIKACMVSIQAVPCAQTNKIDLPKLASSFKQIHLMMKYLSLLIIEQKIRDALE